MALAVDSRQQQPQFHSMGYESMRYAGSQAPLPQPQFNNPWASAQGQSNGMYSATSMANSSDAQRYATHAPATSQSYTGVQLPSASSITGILPVIADTPDQSSLQYNQDGVGLRSYGGSYGTTAASVAPAYTATAAPQYAPYGYQSDRRASHPSVASNLFIDDIMESQRYRQSSLVDIQDRFNAATDAERESFSQALDASRGMISMSQSDITPRNIYDTQLAARVSSDAYGFPSAHSPQSSISSASYPNYYNSSVSEASLGDYSSATESIDMPTSRTLPRPHALLGGALPPAPSSMMGQFSSKVSSSSQKKHKCKVCDKRFTRPSSLQTHMYSHTGEKPFACDVEGCGRHFSVVSNLRRHRKVHRDGRDPSSPDDDEDYK